MLLKPYNQIDKDRKDPYSMEYTGTVVDNNDPKHLKRVKVNLEIWDYLTDDQLQWVIPEGSGKGNNANSDEQDIPEVGSEVAVYFRNNDPNDPRYKGAEITEETKCSLFDEDYPNTYGKKDSAGNFTMHNKRTGISVFHHNSGTQIQMDPDGSYTITGKSGCVAHCDADGNWQFKGTSMKFVMDEEINMQATRVKITAENGLDLNGGEVNIQALNNCNIEAPETKVSGGTAKFNCNTVVVENMLDVTKAQSYDLIDPISKTVLNFSRGILTGKVGM